jgi:hypothetical protein
MLIVHSEHTLRIECERSALYPSPWHNNLTAFPSFLFFLFSFCQSTLSGSTASDCGVGIAIKKTAQGTRTRRERESARAREREREREREPDRETERQRETVSKLGEKWQALLLVELLLGTTATALLYSVLISRPCFHFGWTYRLLIHIVIDICNYI